MVNGFMHISIGMILGFAGGVLASETGASSVSSSVQEELIAVLAEDNNLGTTDSNSLGSEVVRSVKDFQHIRQKLMFQQIEPIKELTLQEKTKGLQQMVERLRSLQLSPTMMWKQDVDQAITDPNDSVVKGETSGATNMEVPTAALTCTTVDEFDAQENLLKQLQVAESVLYPLALADTLYRQGHYEAALKYYESLQASLAKNDLVNHQWVLFQMGNCCRVTDPTRALGLYAEFIHQYPNAKWTAVVKSRKLLLEWDQTSRIEELVSHDVTVANR
jgi:hypothetical protein